MPQPYKSLRRLGLEEKALEWKKRALLLWQNITKYFWKGRFFVHQLHLNHDGADNLEGERLSTAYDMNRALTAVEKYLLSVRPVRHRNHFPFTARGLSKQP